MRAWLLYAGLLGVAALLLVALLAPSKARILSTCRALLSRRSASDDPSFPPAGRRQRDVIFTCTTYLSKPNKCQHFVRALDSIGEKHLIDKFVVINEYDPAEPVALESDLRRRFPFVCFVQKTAAQRGQAYTMNMILDLVRPFKYWIHWEESWEARAPFVREALRIMDSDRSLTQLQLTPDWHDIDARRRRKCEGYEIISVAPAYHDIPHDAHDMDALVARHGLENSWPLYSLRPSLNRVSHYAELGPFDEDPSLWPWRFEYDFGLRWIRSGAVKAVLRPPVAFRQAHHVSTYA